MTTKRIKRVISFPERIQNVGTMLLFKVFRFLHRAGYGKQGGGGEVHNISLLLLQVSM
jgi:hypothetical protein